MSQTQTVDDLVRSIRAGARPSYFFFWGHRASGGHAVGKWCLSQWWPAAFTVDGVTYATAEHFMMAGKARLFGDAEALTRILAAPDPNAAKKLGRSVRGFDDARWIGERYKLVVAGNKAKFSQHPALGNFLRSIREDVIVEASPMDTIWGIGLAQGSPDATNPERWRGLNLLGFALMDVRATLRDPASI
jgi:ribA/ribD-fused uncharacterized protein